METPTQFDNNLWKAGAAVADSLSQFENAMDALVSRLELTTEQLQKLKEIKTRAENILNQVIGFSQTAVHDIKKNPKPYIALAAVIGFFVLARSRHRETAARITH